MSALLQEISERGCHVHINIAAHIYPVCLYTYCSKCFTYSAVYTVQYDSRINTNYILLYSNQNNIRDTNEKTHETQRQFGFIANYLSQADHKRAKATSFICCEPALLWYAVVPIPALYRQFPLCCRCVIIADPSPCCLPIAQFCCALLYLFCCDLQSVTLLSRFLAVFDTCSSAHG